jgi:hypothetical protein
MVQRGAFNASIDAFSPGMRVGTLEEHKLEGTAAVDFTRNETEAVHTRVREQRRTDLDRRLRRLGIRA